MNPGIHMGGAAAVGAKQSCLGAGKSRPSPIMNIDNQIRQSKPSRPVGTGGRVGWMRGPGAQYISLKDLLTSVRSKRIKQVNKIKKLILRLKWLRRRHLALLGFLLAVALLDLPAVDA